MTNRRYLPGEQPIVDVWSTMHAYVGSVYGVSGLSWQTALGLAIAWEVFENPLKDRWPSIFPDAKYDSYPNALGDIGAVMLGWWVGRQL